MHEPGKIVRRFQEEHAGARFYAEEKMKRLTQALVVYKKLPIDIQQCIYEIANERYRYSEFHGEVSRVLCNMYLRNPVIKLKLDQDFEQGVEEIRKWIEQAKATRITFENQVRI